MSTHKNIKAIHNHLLSLNTPPSIGVFETICQTVEYPHIIFVDKTHEGICKDCEMVGCNCHHTECKCADCTFMDDKQKPELLDCDVCVGDCKCPTDYELAVSAGNKIDCSTCGELGHESGMHFDFSLQESIENKSTYKNGNCKWCGVSTTSEICDMCDGCCKTCWELETDCICREYLCTICGKRHPLRDCLRYKTVMCRNNPCTRDNCTFAHSRKELITIPKCTMSKYVDGVLKVFGCGGLHAFEMCKKRYCTTCKTSEHWCGEFKKCIVCSYCQGTDHIYKTCPKAYCNSCGGDHWIKYCPTGY